MFRTEIRDSRLGLAAPPATPFDAARQPAPHELHRNLPHEATPAGGAAFIIVCGDGDVLCGALVGRAGGGDPREVCIDAPGGNTILLQPR